MTYEWAKNKNIRRFSINNDPIPYEIHKEWFEKRLFDKECIYLIFENIFNIPMGSVRIDIKGEVGEISYLLDEKFQSKGLGKILLKQLENYLINNRKDIYSLIGKVLKENIPSITIFKKLNYNMIEEKYFFLFKKTIKE